MTPSQPFTPQERQIILDRLLEVLEADLGVNLGAAQLDTCLRNYLDSLPWDSQGNNPSAS